MYLVPNCFENLYTLVDNKMNDVVNNNQFRNFNSIKDVIEIFNNTINFFEEKNLIKHFCVILKKFNTFINNDTIQELKSNEEISNMLTFYSKKFNDAISRNLINYDPNTSLAEIETEIINDYRRHSLNKIKNNFQFDQKPVKF